MQELRDGLGLSDAKLEEQTRTPSQGTALADLCDQTPDEVQPVGAAVESRAGFPVPDLGLEARHVGAGDIGQVGRDRGEAPGRELDGVEQIRLEPADAIFEAEADSVVCGEGEGGGRGVDAGQVGLVAGLGDGEGDRTRACADVEDLHEGGRRRPQRLEQPVDEVLGLGPGDQHATIDEEIEVEGVKTPGSFDVGDGFAGQAAADELTEVAAVLLRQQAIVLKVELEALAAERAREEVLGVDAGLLDAEGLEALGGPCEQLSHGPAGVSFSRGHRGDVTRRGLLGKWDRPKIFSPESSVLPAKRPMTAHNANPELPATKPAKPARRGSALIEFSRVSKTYGSAQRPALHDVSLAIGRGEFALVMGPSGAGKSTLLQLILAMEQPDHGTIRVAGRNVHRLTQASIPYLRRNLGAVFQDFKLLPEATPLENVRLTLQVLGLRRRDVVGRARAALTRVGIDPDSRKPVRCMSGGEQQRVALARALAGRPPILLADEPTGNLDPALTRDILRALELIRASGTTILLATHDPVVYQHAAASRVLHLEGGRLIEDRVLDRTPEFIAEIDDNGDPVDWIAAVDDDEFSDEPLLVDHAPLGEVA